ncbi:MAG TPA: hypothetical protein DCM62_10355 [Bacteroidales bacterium]|nr:hypothetical protein [Bacteroidales bacterium]
MGNPLVLCFVMNGGSQIVKIFLSTTWDFYSASQILPIRAKALANLAIKGYICYSSKPISDGNFIF